MKYDFHLHSLLSDGDLLPSELWRRLSVLGMEGIVLTDHVDGSNFEEVIKSTLEVCRRMSRNGYRIIPGVEITHVPPEDIKPFIKEVKSLGARVVVVHGETIAEPVASGTNLAAVDGGADILAHPGLITEDVVKLASKKRVFLEISYRKGHSLGNGRVVSLARNHSALLCLNSDAHSPSDLQGPSFRVAVAKGAGLSDEEIKVIESNMEKAFRGWFSK